MSLTEKEFEIKLSIPRDKFKTLENFLISKGGFRRQHLQAFYIDTKSFTLAKSDIALRVRKEGRIWIQTLKAKGQNQFERLEHNVHLPHWDPQQPLIDLTLHAEHPAGKVLRRVLGKNNKHELTVRYQTDIWRRKAEIKGRGALLEYSLDEGVISGLVKDGRILSLPVCEVEIELLQGDPLAVMTQVKSLIHRFKGHIDVRSKAQRGFNLSLGRQHAEPLRAHLTQLSGYEDHQIVASIVDDCLKQIIANASEINAGIENYDEHLHQLRVGLRRLKTALKVLSLDQFELPQSQADVLQAIFLKLGLYRDSNYLYEKLNPALLDADGPTLDLGHHEQHAHPSIFLSEKSFQLFLLYLITLVLEKQKPAALKAQSEFTEESLTSDLKLDEPLKLKIIKMLSKVHRVTKKTSQHFLLLPEEQKHALRKKLKRFRYTLEFFSEFSDRKKFTPFMKALRRALEHLGDYNDICVAIDYINSSLVHPTPHWFALGWLKAEQKRLEHLSSISLDEFFALKKVW